jgi:hypothetical protein
MMSVAVTTFFYGFLFSFCRQLVNNTMFVYQHSARCPLAMQRFLEKNPEYWCLVPQSWHEARMEDASASSILATRQLQEQQSPTLGRQRMFFGPLLEGTTRSQDEAEWLKNGVPKPPAGYRFSRRQMEQQIQFFKSKKDRCDLSSNIADLYNYAIVAVCMYSSFSTFQ